MPNANLSLVILEQSAHCDWDWLQTFDQYFVKAYSGFGVRGLLSAGIKLVTNTPGYTYVFCEVSFLKKYFESNPPDLDDWRNAIAAGTFRFSSGGFTSAENLTLHTESFIRNYLLGRWWLKNTLDATASLRMWVPDDFGHDAQLPVLLQALGYTGVAFWRIPVAGPEAPPSGTVQINGSSYTVSASSSAPSAFLVADNGNGAIGVDFVWQAADGSATQVHWLMNSYSEGNTDLGSDTSSPNANGLDEAVSGTTSYQGLTPSGIAFIPIDNDFAMPYEGLPDALAGWSNGGVTAQLGTFDDFMTQANVDLQTVLSNPQDGSSAFVPHPYYSGCYASHPMLKILHYATVRTLLMAETAALILELLGDSSSAQEAISAAWWAALPSTHHDYITGTAPNEIYEIEQKKDIEAAYAMAQAAQQSVVSTIAAAIDGTGIDGTPFAIFNAISFPTSGSLVQIACDDPSQFNSSTIDGSTFLPVQQTTDGTGVLALVSLQPMGYQSVWLTAKGTTESPVLSITNNGDGSFTLENSVLKATVTTGGITELYDLIAGSGNLFPNADGNALVYYQDSGSIYRFASEVPWYGGTDGADGSMTFQPVAFTSSLTIAQIEDGPLRVTVQVTGTVTVNGEEPVDLEIAYSLVANEPFLRIVTTSAAPGTRSGPNGYSVMVSFPFAPFNDMSELAYGTTSHWDRRAPRQWFDWSPNPPDGFDFLTFEPAHEFVVPYDTSGGILGAIYHSSSPAWAISADRTSLLGCILRNTPNSAGNGASGWDTDSHSLSYAVRIPSGLNDPSQALSRTAPLVEALLLNNPPVASGAIPQGAATLPAQLSVATTVDVNALVTAAKLGTMDDSQLILRVYQPLNTATTTSVQIDTALANLFSIDGATAVTALEDAAADNVTIVSKNGNTIVITMNNALATLALPAASSGQ